MHHKVSLGALSTLLGVMLCSVFSSAYAADIKIGYLDYKSAIENTSKYQKALHRLEALVDAKKKEAKGLQDKIIKIQDDLRGQSMTMNPTFRAQKEQELGRLKLQLERMGQDAEMELGQKKQMMDKASMEKFRKVVADYGKKHGYDMIVLKPMILYANPKYDVTPEITKLMDAAK
jgi:outer membrane protein